MQCCACESIPPQAPGDSILPREVNTAWESGRVSFSEFDASERSSSAATRQPHFVPHHRRPESAAHRCGAWRSPCLTGGEHSCASEEGSTLLFGLSEREREHH